jgi:hypothetical protein
MQELESPKGGGSQGTGKHPFTSAVPFYHPCGHLLVEADALAHQRSPLSTIPSGKATDRSDLRAAKQSSDSRKRTGTAPNQQSSIRGRE